MADEVLVQRTVVGDKVFRITASQAPSATEPGTFITTAEYYYINDVRVVRQVFVRALQAARAADDRAHRRRY